MPFGPITAQTKTYEPRQPGVYSLSTVVFGQPLNEYRIRGASLSKDNLLRSSVSRVLEKDSVVNGVTTRKSAIITLNITAPTSDFTGSELDSLAEDISVFLTASTVSRLMQGES